MDQTEDSENRRDAMHCSIHVVHVYLWEGQFFFGKTGNKIIFFEITNDMNVETWKHIYSLSRERSPSRENPLFLTLILWTLVHMGARIRLLKIIVGAFCITGINAFAEKMYLCYLMLRYVMLHRGSTSPWFYWNMALPSKPTSSGQS